jgi:hypothetical protein
VAVRAAREWTFCRAASALLRFREEVGTRHARPACEHGSSEAGVIENVTADSRQHLTGRLPTVRVERTPRDAEWVMPGIRTVLITGVSGHVGAAACCFQDVPVLDGFDSPERESDPER